MKIVKEVEVRILSKNKFLFLKKKQKKILLFILVSMQVIEQMHMNDSIVLELHFDDYLHITFQTINVSTIVLKERIILICINYEKKNILVHLNQMQSKISI